MKKCKKILALLLSILMVFTMVSSSVVAVEETSTEKMQIEETEITDIFASVKGIIDGAHDLAGTIIEFFGKDCPFCDEAHNKKDNVDEDENTSEPTEPDEPKEDASIKDDIDGAVDAGFNLFNAIHNLVGGILAVFDKECPFCDQIHDDKSNDEIEEPTDPVEPTVPIGKTYSVTFNTNGGNEIEKQTVKEGEAAIEPDEPTKEGVSFDGWYTDEALTEKFDFSTVITSDITLYAAWEEKSEAEQYFEKNAQLIDIVEVEESEDVMTESEVKSFLEDRGFEDCQITYSYSINGEYGNYGDKTEISEESTDKHPTYQMIYLSESGEAWIIDIINGSIFASPFYYNVESETGIQLLVSETNELVSYDSEGSKFYITIPNDTEVVVKVIDRIDSKTLDGLTGEELSK